MFKILSPFVLAMVASAALAQQGQSGLHFVENWDRDADGQLSEAEAVKRRSEIFVMFDEDENGLLDASEHKLFDETRAADMEAQGGAGGHGELSGVNKGTSRAFTDTDGDVQVSRAEFEARSPDWFAAMDRNGDGIVTTETFGRCGG